MAIIVAIPRKDQPVWDISSEPIPHLTLMYLSDDIRVDLDRIGKYIEHVVNTSLVRFGLYTNRRGELGSEKADVLFFDKRDTKLLEEIRSYFLKDKSIFEPYIDAEQFDSWTPHLTIGYPDNPAKKSTEIPTYHWIEFDKIALWTGDYEGPFEFELSEAKFVEQTALIGRNYLEHFGVKGMKWGVRKKSKKTSMPDYRSEDARRVDAAKDAVRAHGTKALSTKELQQLVIRMNLDQQYNALKSREPTKMSKGHDALKKALAMGTTVGSIYTLTKSPAGKAAIRLGASVIRGV